MRLKLSQKIIVMIGFILALHAVFPTIYIIKSEKTRQLKKAYSKAEDINRILLISLLHFSAMGIRSENAVHDALKGLQMSKTGDVIEIRLIHSPNITKTFKDRDIAEKYKMMVEEYPRDEIEKRAAAGEAYKGETEVDIKGAKYRAIKFISPIKA